MRGLLLCVPLTLCSLFIFIAHVASASDYEMRRLQERRPLAAAVLAIASCQQMGCMCIVLPVAVAAVGVRSCLAAKTLQLQLFDGICQGYTPTHTQMHRHSHRRSHRHRHTQSLCAAGACLDIHLPAHFLQPRRCSAAGSDGRPQASDK